KAGGDCYDPANTNFSAACPNWFKASGPAASWNVSGVDWTDATGGTARYYIVARSSDFAGNVQSEFNIPVSSLSFSYDTTPPTVLITTTSAGRNKSLLTFTGTATDAPAGIALVQMRIQSLGPAANNQWWKGNQASPNFDPDLLAPDAFFAVDPTPSWTSWQVSSGGTVGTGFVVGNRYEYSLRARDTSGNWSTTYSTYSVVWDNAAPESRLTSPPGGAFKAMNALSSIKGTMADKTNAGNDNLGIVTEVRVKLRRLDTGAYWNTSDWGGEYNLGQANAGDDGPSGQVDFDLAGGTWAVTGTLPTGSNLPYGTSYYVTISAQDNADAVSNPNAANNIELFNVYASTFVYDSSVPYTTVNSPAHLAMLSALSSITGTMADEPTRVEETKVSAGISRVQVQISSNVGACYDGASAWTACPYWIQASTTAQPGALGWISSGTWTLGSGSLPSWEHGKNYYILARSSDNAGMTESEFLTATLDSMTVTFDLFRPTSTVMNLISTIAAGPFYVNNTFSVLSGSATDIPADVSTMTIALSSHPSAAEGSWWNGTTFTGTFGSDGAAVYFGTSSWIEGGASGTDSWNWNHSNVIPGSLVHASTYTARIRTRDKASPFWERVQDTVFKYDAVKPTATITFPANDYSTNTAINITGVSADSGFGVSTVTVYIEKAGGDCYDPANTNFSAACPNWFKASGPAASWNVSGVDWTDATGGTARYYIVARSSDFAGNVQSEFNIPVSSLSFSYDIVAPTSFVTSIASTSFYRNITQISGTATDTNMVSLLSRVEIEIKNFGNDNAEGGVGGNADTYWDGDDFGAAVSSYNAVSFVGGSSGTWSYNIGGWTNSRKYKASVRALDSAGNQEADEGGPVFTIDFSSPIASITQPAKDSGWQVFPAVSGTSNDGSGDTVNATQAGIHASTNVQVAIVRQDNQDCWQSGWFATACPRWNNAAFAGASSGAWSFSGYPSGPTDAPSGVRYLVLARARDISGGYPGNEQAAFDIGVSSVIFYIDNTSGTATVDFPSPNSQRASLVLTSGTITDTAGGSGAYQAVLEISTQTGGGTASYWTGAAWMAPGVSTSVFVLAASTGVASSTWGYTSLPGDWGVSGATVTIQVRAKDVTGNIQNTANQMRWLYDTDPPTTLVTVPVSNGDFHSPVNPLPNLQGTATETPNSPPFTKVQEVLIRLRDDDGGPQYWTGSSWTTT
ncbi:MAG: hypothetical protein HY581_01625, partial [Nitrospirae bacterium]|nr:hypothetical protein [Nitrospirota bacterium]